MLINYALLLLLSIPTEAIAAPKGKEKDVGKAKDSKGKESKGKEKKEKIPKASEVKLTTLADYPIFDSYGQKIPKASEVKLTTLADYPILDSYGQRCSRNNDTLQFSANGCAPGYVCRKRARYLSENVANLNSDGNDLDNISSFINGSNYCSLRKRLSDAVGQKCGKKGIVCPAEGTTCKRMYRGRKECTLCGTEYATCGESRDAITSKYSYVDCCPGYTCTNVTAIQAITLRSGGWKGIETPKSVCILNIRLVETEKSKTYGYNGVKVASVPKASEVNLTVIPADYPIFDSYGQRCSPTNDTLEFSVNGCAAGYKCRKGAFFSENAEYLENALGKHSFGNDLDNITDIRNTITYDNSDDDDVDSNTENSNATLNEISYGDDLYNHTDIWNPNADDSDDDDSDDDDLDNENDRNILNSFNQGGRYCSLGKRLSDAVGKKCGKKGIKCPGGTYCKQLVPKGRKECTLCGTEYATCGESRDAITLKYSYADCCPGFTCTNVTAIQGKQIESGHWAGRETSRFVCVSNSHLVKRAAWRGGYNGIRIVASVNRGL